MTLTNEQLHTYEWLKYNSEYPIKVIGKYTFTFLKNLINIPIVVRKQNGQLVDFTITQESIHITGLGKIILRDETFENERIMIYDPENKDEDLAFHQFPLEMY